MKEFNRIAVLLVGELRSWARASKYLINFFNQRAQQVDYYLVTWDVTTITSELITVSDQDVLIPFDQNNVKPYRYKILETIGRRESTFYNQAWLAKVANLLKRQVEVDENFIYDQVIETRPDIYLRRTNLKWEACGDFEFEAGCVDHPHTVPDGLAHIPDYYYRTNSFTNDILANRYANYFGDHHYTTNCHIGWNFTNQHWLIVQYLFDRRLQPRVYPRHYSLHYLTDDYHFFCCIRPNFPEDLDLDSVDYTILDNWFISWNRTLQDQFYYQTETKDI